MLTYMGKRNRVFPHQDKSPQSVVTDTPQAHCSCRGSSDRLDFKLQLTRWEEVNTLRTTVAIQVFKVYDRNYEL